MPNRYKRQAVRLGIKTGTYTETVFMVCPKGTLSLPNSSVTVIDDAPFHGKKHSNVPSIYATEKAITDWFQTNGVPETVSTRILYRVGGTC
jgi:hypothetical protein